MLEEKKSSRKPYPISWSEQSILFGELPAHLHAGAGSLQAEAGLRDRSAGTEHLRFSDTGKPWRKTRAVGDEEWRQEADRVEQRGQVDHREAARHQQGMGAPIQLHRDATYERLGPEEGTGENSETQAIGLKLRTWYQQPIREGRS